MPPPTDPDIFHITHFGNLTGILAEGGLWSDADRIRRQLAVRNIGYTHIKNRRMFRRVTAAAGGVLGDYVPFNFCPRSVMLYAVYRGHDDYDGGQDQVIHLRSTARTAIGQGQPWMFTDRHAELSYARYFESLSDLGEVEWSVMPLRYWAGDPDERERRQAEFLVHQFFDWAGVLEIGVKDATVAAAVSSSLAGQNPAPVVSVRPDWYY